jgi:hypothetical protein
MTFDNAAGLTYAHVMALDYLSTHPLAKTSQDIKDLITEENLYVQDGYESLLKFLTENKNFD